MTTDPNRSTALRERLKVITAEFGALRSRFEDIRKRAKATLTSAVQRRDAKKAEEVRKSLGLL